MLMLLCKHSTAICIFESGVRNVSQSIYRQTEEKRENKTVMVGSVEIARLCITFICKCLLINGDSERRI